jgi:signal transduction histidine kinase
MNDVIRDLEAVPAPRADSLSDLILEHTEFFATLSHELRTPLATLKGFGQSLLDHWDALPEARRRQHVEFMLRSTARLERLVGDISLSAHLVDGVALTPASVPVDDVLAQGIREARTLHPERVFHLLPGISTPQVWADRERLLQVLVNLLDNAAKYSPPELPITVRWCEGESQVRIEVCDAGLSLSREDRDALFVAYGRLHSPGKPASAATGSGLGLYICKGLVEAMRGAIGTRAGDDGNGNVFWFTLPAMEMEQEAAS